MWFSTFREHIIFALSGHVIFAKICSLLAPQVALESPDISMLHVTLMTKDITPYGIPEKLILSFFHPTVQISGVHGVRYAGGFQQYGLGLRHAHPLSLRAAL